MMTRAQLLLAVLPTCLCYWDGDRDMDDPYTAAMKMSRMAQLDPEVMRRDPDHFRRLFGNLAVEQSQAKKMDETQSAASEKDLCMACHGTVVEFEKMMVERKSAATGGLGGRGQLAVADALEKICHLNRYEFQDGVDLRNRVVQSTQYGGMDPAIFANACKKVIDKWSDHLDESVEEILIAGGDPAGLHKELRDTLCYSTEWGQCAGVKDKSIEVLAVEVDTMAFKGSEYLQWKDEESKCEDPNAKGKKKKKKQVKKDPITQEELDSV